MQYKPRLSFVKKKTKIKYVISCLISVLLIGWLIFCFLNLNNFLSANKPVDAKILIVEGWVPDNVLKRARNLYIRDHYQLLITTGGPIVNGYYLAEYKTYAVLAAKTLQKLGMDPNSIQAIPAPEVSIDRTLASAVAVRQWMDRTGIRVASVNLLSLGPHARRSWLLYRKVFAQQKRVGIIAIPDSSYVPPKWWTTSNGFRTVINELIGYIYVKLLGKA